MQKANVNQDEIINFYLKNSSLNKTAKQFNISVFIIKKILMQNNIRIKSTGEINRKYTLNESYFETIDTEQKAYILGLIAADGGIGAKLHHFSIGLQAGDEHILHEIRDCLSSNYKIKIIKRQNPNHQDTALLSVFSVKLISQLLKYNLTPRKSLTLKRPPENSIPDNLLIHFLRGFFDGDGGLSKNIRIYKTGKTYLNLIFAITATKDICLFFQNIIKEKTGLKSTIKVDRNMYDLKIFGNKNVLKFLDYLYKDANIKLKRKYDIYLEGKQQDEEIENRKKLKKTSKYQHVHFNKRLKTYAFEFNFNKKTYRKQGLKSEEEAFQLCQLKKKELNLN